MNIIEELKNRFNKNIKKTKTCWVWLGSTDTYGYGRITINYVVFKAHRLSYMIFKGIIKPNYLICHTCDNPLCVNPDHLFEGTPKQNTLDCIKKHRNHNQSKTKCKNNHKYMKETIYWQFNKKTNKKCRVCLICKRIREKINYHKHHA